MIETADVRARLDVVIAAMRASGVWDVVAPGPYDPRDMGAFGMGAMAFEQWLRWVFVPNVEELIAAGGPWPDSSSVAVQAVREGDTNPAVDALVPALSAFDELFAPAEEPNAHGWRLMTRKKHKPNDLDRAAALFRLAIARGTAAAASNLGDVLLAQGRDDDAIGELEALAAREDAVGARACNWLGWYFTAKRPDPARALAHLEAGIRLAPSWGPVRLNLAKALDATGDLSRACAAYGEAIACGDAHEDAFARDRRLQLEMQLLARGEPPPPPPETARADSAAFAIVQATAARLATAHTFMIRPTQRGAGRVMPAVIGTVVGGRALGHCIVGATVHTLARKDDRLVLADGDHLLAWIEAGVDAAALTPIDAAMYLFDRFRTDDPWWWEVRDATTLVVHTPPGVDVAVSPRAGGGVLIGVEGERFEVPLPERLLAVADEILAAIGRAAERTR